MPAPAAVVVPPRKSRAPIFFIGAFSGCALVFLGFFFLAVLFAAMKDDPAGMRFGAEHVAVVAIEGEILDARDAVDALHKYADTDSVKAIVMRINSPGGAIAPSQEIYEEIRKTRERSGKPIVASLDSVAASGGFYIAAACDRIIANPGSITGSIGVILQWMNTKDLLAWAKVRPETITSGPLKAAGSPYSDMTDAERAYFQRIVTQLHGQFVKAVAQGRKGKITEAEVGALADGRVFTGEEAKALKLVDELGNLDDAVRSAAKMGGIEGEPAMLYPKKRKGGLLDVLSDGGDASSLIERVVSRRVPSFLYRW
ncbi:MAG TPA: signal peptide peptidase SppA [Thermoanaerobaculia bacterium]|nr:signal peptide peptidase SppA [Thermoanaerobaculia bacterium]